MFTGIIAEVGSIASITRGTGVVRFAVKADHLSTQVEAGDSVAVNGVCQTVTDVKPGRLSYQSVRETLKRTNLERLRRGSPVNLEPALRLGDRISGHLVSGHVDATGIVRIRRVVSHSNLDFAVQVPDDISRFVYEKGSICLDGVSLTVKAIHGAVVEVTVIPYTLRGTIIGHWRIGTVVNVEVDQVAKYLTAEGWRTGGGKA